MRLRASVGTATKLPAPVPESRIETARGEPDRMAHRVYVIELAPEAGKRRDPRIPWVYVGSSAREPEIRFAQHRRGYKSAGLVKRHGRHLRPDLYEDIGPIRGSRAAVAAELERAAELASAGFVAHSDGVHHGAGEGSWTAWDLDRLDRVRDRFEAAAGELAESTFEPADPIRLARLLAGERGFWVADYLDQNDAPPGYGMFPHVELSALERAAARLAPLATAR